jgi:hypothetical protein
VGRDRWRSRPVGGHDFLPLRLADAEQNFAVVVATAEGGYIHLCGLPCFGIRNRSAGDADGVSTAVGLWPRMPTGPLAADVLEVRADYLAVECMLRAPPDLGGTAGAFQVAPGRAHDRVVEGQQRFCDPVCRPVFLEGFRLMGDESGVVQDAEWVCQVG